jgi:hypothetical protein
MVWFHAEKSTTLARSLSSGLLYVQNPPLCAARGTKASLKGGKLQRVINDIDRKVFIIPLMS